MVLPRGGRVFASFAADLRRGYWDRPMASGRSCGFREESRTRSRNPVRRIVPASPHHCCGHRLFLRRHVLDVHLLDGAVELERDLVVVVKRHRRTVNDADVEAVVGSEEQWGRYWHLARRNTSPLTFMVMLSGPAGLGTAYAVSTSIFTLPTGASWWRESSCAG